MSVPAVQPAPEPEPYDLRAEARRFAEQSSEINPHALAAAFARTIPESELRGVATDLCSYVFRDVARRKRQGSSEPPGGGSAKWDAVREANESGALRWLEWEMPAADGVWKLLPTCGPEDVEAIVAGYESRATANATWAKRYTLVGHWLERNEAATVGDLDAMLVARILGLIPSNGQETDNA